MKIFSADLKNVSQNPKSKASDLNSQSGELKIVCRLGVAAAENFTSFTLTMTGDDCGCTTTVTFTKDGQSFAMDFDFWGTPQVREKVWNSSDPVIPIIDTSYEVTVETDGDLVFAVTGNNILGTSTILGETMGGAQQAPKNITFTGAESNLEFSQTS